MEQLTIKIQGTAPLLMHNIRLADPLDPMTMQLKELTGLKKKSHENFHQMARVEWEGGLYWSKEMGPYVPGWNIIRSLRDGAALSKAGKDIYRGVACPDRVPVEYDGPRDIEGMYAAHMFDRRAVGVGMSRTIRVRPRFNSWALTIEMDVVDDIISAKDVAKHLATAGRFVGLGDYRPGSPKGGRFGRYEVASVNGKAIKAAA